MAESLKKLDIEQFTQLKFDIFKNKLNEFKKTSNFHITQNTQKKSFYISILKELRLNPDNIGLQNELEENKYIVYVVN